MFEFVDCHRCGYTFEVNRKRRKLRMLCQSCRVTKATTIRTEDKACLPWHGNFGVDLVTPIDDEGHPVHHGIRTCGNNDCVQTAHIEG